MITATKIFTFDSAHFLPGYKGKCANIHGHTYKLEVTVGNVNEVLIVGGSSDGMVMDFYDLKMIVEKHLLEQWDHKLINETGKYETIRPTAENMCNQAFYTISSHLPFGIRVTSVKLWETPTSYVEVTE